MTEPRLLVIDLDATTSHELFATVSSRLVDEGLAKPSFLTAAEGREATYPTGLDFGHTQVAIPHVDPDHVIAPGLVVCRNKRTTVFHAMDDPERKLDVRLSIWPLVTDPHNQVGMLGAVIDLLQDPPSCRLLITADDADVHRAVRAVMNAIEPAT
ncbi:PTS sugar transporter subunit IIA [Cutibacterium sp.]|uniref:PTS sugar transporter subunit IIA n=1 Tax=Cutibacterium sp. TaxID=1912221 RepID=UPI0026DD7613|nr:PTS sugar transporter subunit IIA [Cutibacterium sp.]MDO4412844.1 PTS sugar transporter subunit IIA [Cutibacterium sp.]